MVLTALPPTDAVYDRIAATARTSAAAGFHHLTFQAMSAPCRVHFQAADTRQALEFQGEVLAWVAGFEAQYSRFLPGSMVSRINAAAGRHWVDIDPETEALLGLCQQMVFLTQGIFDPTLLPLLRLWNWKARPVVLPEPAVIEQARALVGWHRVQRRPGAVFLPAEGMCLDFGGIGKEYAVDRVAMLALQHGIRNLLVDFGADVIARGQPPERGAWHIGLEDPDRPGNCWVGLAVTDRAVATSGDYLRHFEHQGRRYGHILDPRSGWPVDNGVRSVSIVAPYCTFAGILSTAAFVLGAQEGLALIARCPGAEGCITTDAGGHREQLVPGPAGSPGGNAPRGNLTRIETKGFHAYRTS